MNKPFTFDDLPAPDIELDLSYKYYFKAGRYQGLPENCCPDEEDMDITLPEGWETVVMNAYISAARDAMKTIESRVQDMLFDSLPREWAMKGEC